ncbi:MAG: acyl-CoA thioesterase [Acidobacteriota bacterium]|jgi:acyl-CoA hydrolase
MDLSAGRVTTVHLIMPNDTNPLGSLFGGRAVEWMDIAAGLAARRLSKHTPVTASIERLDFKVPIRWGEIAVVESEVISVGRTSMSVQVDMYREVTETGARQLCTSGLFHMVALDAEGHPTPVFTAEKA